MGRFVVRSEHDGWIQEAAPSPEGREVMPVHVEKRGPKFVTVDPAGKVHGRSDTKAKADASARAINAAHSRKK